MQPGVGDAMQGELTLTRVLAVIVVAYAGNLVVVLVTPARVPASTASWLEDPEAGTEASGSRGIRAAGLGDEPNESASGEQTSGNQLVFRDADAALEYACRYMNTDVGEGAMLQAVVVDAREEFGTDQPVKVLDSGVQIGLLRVAANDGHPPVQHQLMMRALPMTPDEVHEVLAVAFMIVLFAAVVTVWLYFRALDAFFEELEAREPELWKRIGQPGLLNMVQLPYLRPRKYIAFLPHLRQRAKYPESGYKHANRAYLMFLVMFGIITLMFTLTGVMVTWMTYHGL